MLQTLIDARLRCKGTVEVVNAGTEAYNLQNNLERVRRDVIPLRPDLVVSYHGYNGLRHFGLLRSARIPQRKERASPLISEVSYRIRLGYRLTLNDFVPPASDEGHELSSQYADLYRELISLGRMNGFRVVLSTSSMAVNKSSPEEVKNFYGSVFLPIDAVIEANGAHNRIVRRIATDEHVPLIDTTASLDGVWNGDLYLDLVHFTENGNEQMASAMFQGLLPILREDNRPGCTIK
jgi:lysophospholipase L1-like esterase